MTTTDRHIRLTATAGRLLAVRLVALLWASLWAWLPASANSQKFFNLTAQQVKIDSLLPVFSYEHVVGYHYADSVYTATIEYPEFIAMSEADVARYRQLSGDAPLPAMPEVTQTVSVSRKQGSVHFSLMPLVCRDGQYLKLVSFMLDIKARPLTARRASANRRAADGRYADHSVLGSGTWVKIRIPATGIYQLTDDLLHQAGLSNINKVKVYGYGGGLQPEKLTAEYLQATDDLMEVPTCLVGSRRLFYAIGPVTWDDNHQRIRNPYSEYGYYFLTESDDEPLTLSESEFLEACYPLADDYNTLYEVDDYAWYHGGRNLYDATEIKPGTSKQYTLASTGTTANGTMTVVLTAYGASTATIQLNGEELTPDGSSSPTISIPGSGSYEHMRVATRTFTVSNLAASNTITVTTGANSGTARLDYISLHADTPKDAPDLTATFPMPGLVGTLTQQDYHAHAAADMVIVVPTSQKLLTQAQRLKALHEQYDGMRVQIVFADELFNEFSSGTPDANAYRRYLKMLYDRAATEADMPRYLLLFGDGAWDNRMLCKEWAATSPDDFLLCYESDNSYSATDCYVSDDYFCVLDDGEGGNLLSNDKPDVAVGRIPARNIEEATIAVDKIASYLQNQQAGAWQNVLCFMGDDGNQNQHMMDADSVARMVETLYPTFLVKRIMWDAYTRVSSATGNSYPDVTRLIRQQMQQGALMMNYAGHGRADAMSHEYVLRLTDFQASSNMRLPLWLTASCDIMPFDGQEDNIGETAFFNEKGGAIAFYGTTRTVYQAQNRLMNLSFTRHVLSRDADNKPMPIGEAIRQAKNELMTTGIITYSGGRPVYSTDRTANKLQYSLLGDPALRLAMPTMGITVDSVNGTPVATAATLTLKAGSKATISGHVSQADGARATAFNGRLTATVRDALEQITCKRNDASEADVPFVYNDRPNTVFNGTDSVRQGRFSFTFAVPKDISYADAEGLVNLYAVSGDKQQEASGIYHQFRFNGSDNTSTENSGPAIYCYLNSTAFTNGGNVNPTPYFVAELSDEDGINASGSGIGHDLQLIIDGDMAKTYSLNDYFQYDFGSYTTGRVGYSIPQLGYGEHKLLFRAWDILNNSSTAELTFNVVQGLEPVFYDVECTKNPASTSTSFRVLHDRTGCTMDVVLDVFDISGRHLWSHPETGISTDNTYTIDWDLTIDGGRRLQTGVYLYRVRISSDGSSYASKAKKLIVLTYK